MRKNVLIIDGHPDPAPERYGHALASAYEEGARSSGAIVKRLRLTDLEIPLLRANAAFVQPQALPDIVAAQAAILEADHLVFIYPLWLGDMPALMKAFLEQAACGGFMLTVGPNGPVGRLKGKSARLIVTMGMPAFWYRFYYGAASVVSLTRNILQLAGINPVRKSFIGMIEAISPEARDTKIAEVNALGAKLI